MKYCTSCGRELVDDAVMCPTCGCAQGNNGASVQKAPDKKSFGWGLLGFCIPLVGLILFLVWKDSTPLKAKSAGVGALVGVIISVVFYILYAVLIGVLVGNGVIDTGLYY